MEQIHDQKMRLAPVFEVRQYRRQPLDRDEAVFEGSVEAQEAPEQGSVGPEGYSLDER